MSCHTGGRSRAACQEARGCPTQTIKITEPEDSPSSSSYKSSPKMARVPFLSAFQSKRKGRIIELNEKGPRFTHPSL